MKYGKTISFRLAVGLPNCLWTGNPWLNILAKNDLLILLFKCTLDN